MGLDSFAITQGEDGGWQPAPDESFEGIELCGGMFSDGGSSIRGKVYDELVRAATGESLYQERIEPARVAEMARRMRTAVDGAKRAGMRTREEKLPALDADGNFQLDEDGNRRMKTFKSQVLDVAGIEIDPEEAEGLVGWFEICAEHGYTVEGWW